MVKCFDNKKAAGIDGKDLSALDGKEAVCGLFCDLHKAFDCVDHQILSNKLE